MSTCPVHGRALVSKPFCPVCRGQQGGLVKSSRKAIAAELNGSVPKKRKKRARKEVGTSK